MLAPQLKFLLQLMQASPSLSRYRASPLTSDYFEQERARRIGVRGSVPRSREEMVKSG